MKSVCKIAIVAAVCFGFVQIHTMMLPSDDASSEYSGGQPDAELNENRQGRASSALRSLRGGAGRLRKSAGEKASSIKSSLTLSDVKNGIKVKLVKVNREERNKLWSCEVPRRDGVNKIISFYRDAIITLDPEIDESEIVVFEGSVDASPTIIARIKVNISNKKIINNGSGRLNKTDVLAVSNSDIFSGDTIIFQKGMRWITKSGTTALLAKQRAK